MKRIIFTALAALTLLCVGAQGVKPLPTLHVEGRWLTDKHGNHVVLHGVMDTPNNYFNSNRWQGSMALGWWDHYNATGAKNCLAYFEKVMTGLETARCNVFRLHLDPAWTNDNSYNYAVAKDQPSTATGEADIKHFNPNRLTSYMKSLYFPLAQKAMNHGMYVVMRPPGVCPQNLKVGDYYQKYLMQVWDIVSKNDSVKKYAGQISLELANEPVNLKNASNQDDAHALHDYFQPIVDKIRENGFTGIIWAPGTGYQSNYSSYAAYPIEGQNIGYAVHDYVGWYNCSDDNANAQAKINQFHSQVPVVDFAPVIITEVDWSPVKEPKELDHTNEFGQPVYKNMGTWATGSTSKWGKAYKAMLDHYKNISMTLSGSDCLIDVPRLLSSGTVTAAFGGNAEACGKACMDWYADYYTVDWPHADDEVQSVESMSAAALSVEGNVAEVKIQGTAHLQLIATFADGHQRDVTNQASFTSSNPGVVAVSGGLLSGLSDGTSQITATYVDPQGHVLTTTFPTRATFFPFGAQNINTSLFANGTYNEQTRTFRPGQWGQMGWEFPAGVDLSAYKYLVVKLKQAQNCDAHLNIFTANSIWSDGFESPGFGSSRQIVVNLKTAKTKNGVALNTSDIHIVCFWANGNGTIVVDDVYVTNNADYSPETTAVETVSMQQPKPCGVYTLSGVLVKRAATPAEALRGLPAGLYLSGGRKVMVKP
ncbi:MAG: cellulase family glycosylhydrolase [Prevotella sp.]|nr:cellulase family glycosylhydrolase [Prevotella sp.]